MALNREAILNAPLKTDTVNVPEWGGDVIIRQLSADALLKHEENKEGSHLDKVARLLIASVVDGENKPIFTEADVETLKQKSPTALMLVANRIDSLNSGGVKAEDAAGN